MDGGRVIALGKLAPRQALPSRVVISALPKAATKSGLGGIVIVQPLPAHSQLVVSFRVHRRLIGKDHRRCKCGRMLAAIVQVHHLQQLLVMGRSGIADQECPK